jgi:transcriptional regulator with XRE-family HTH domain
MDTGRIYTLDSRSGKTGERLRAVRRRMRQWGIAPAVVARRTGVSRQYVWQVLHRESGVTEARLSRLESAVENLIELRKNPRTFGERLRTARLAAGMTLSEAAGMIGYSWVAVERWEKDICLPKPGVLWHLRHLYRVGENWLPPATAPGAAFMSAPSARTALPGAE